MSRTSLLISLGALLLLAPFSGFPIAFRSFVTVGCGVAVVVIGLMLRAENSRQMHETAAPAVQ